MNKKTWILLIVLLVIIGGFFYWWLSQPIETEESEEKSQPPTLFAKEDYKIEEREDGKYIVVEKVGLTCKVPEGWEIKIEGDDIPEPEYWVNLYSPDAEFTSIALTKNCGIGIFVETAKTQVKEIKDSIKFAQEDPKSNEICSIILGTSGCEEHIFEAIKISGYEALKHIPPTHEFFGQGVNINIPIDEKIIVGLETVFPPEYQEKCSPIWEEFLKNIIIE